MKIRILLAAALFCMGIAAAADETEVLEKNWRAIQSRGLDLLPVPKNITFKEPVELKKVTIVGNDKIPYFKVICEEITSRMEELDSKVPVTVSPKKISGTYNIVVDPEPLKHAHYQAYTLTPEKDGIILRGKENNLYPAITLRFLIAGKDGKTVIYPAKVLDYPDYAKRQAYIFAPWVWSRYGDRNPEKTLEMAKSMILAAFRSKLTGVNFMQHPNWRIELQYHRYPLEEARKMIDRGVPVKAVKRINDYIKSLGMRNGIYFVTQGLGTKADKSNPEYAEMMYYKPHDQYFSWARLDLHRKKADIILDFMKRTGYGTLNCHGVDGGFDDPECWSQRDRKTREKFGDDRAVASAAVFKEYMKGMAENDIEFDAVIYPYTGRLMELNSMRTRLNLPDTPGANAHVQKYLDKMNQYCAQINKLMPPHASFTCREAPPKLAQVFYNAYPNRKATTLFFTYEELRDIQPTLPQEIRAFRSNFYEPRGKDLTISTVGGSMLQTPSVVLTGEYSWNTAFPGWEDLDRERNPINYDMKKAALNAERAAEGFYGMKAGKFLKPVYDNMFCFGIMVNPKLATKTLQREFDMLTFLERNHRQLLLALKTIEGAVKLDKKDFKAGSYDEFVEIYLWLKAALPYSIANLTALKIEQAAAAGNFDRCKKLYDEAKKAIPLAVEEYKKADAAMEGKSNRVRRSDLTATWWYNSERHAAGRLFIPDFTQPVKILDDAYAAREKIFSTRNVPVWFKGFFNNLKTVYAPRRGSWPVEHFILIGDGNSDINRGSQYQLCNPAPRLAVQDTGKGLRITGKIQNPNLSKQPPVKLKYTDWPPADSVEILVAPKGSPKGKIFQFVVNPDGNLTTFLHADHGNMGKAISKPHDFGKLPLKTVREKDSWSFDLTVPYDVFGVKTGKGWKILFGYNQDKKQAWWNRNYWSRLLKTNAADLSVYHDLVFTWQETEPAAAVQPFASKITTESRAHDTGAGTYVTFIPGFNTFRPLNNVKFTAVFLDEKGTEISKELQLLDGKNIPAFWQSPAPVVYQLLKPHESFFIRLKVSAEGLQEKTLLIPVGKAEFTVPGPKQGTKAYGSVHKADKPLPFAKGSLSFSVKPNYTGRNRWAFGDQFLVYAGGLNNGFRWTDAIVIRHLPNSGLLISSIYLPKFSGVRFVRALWLPQKDKWYDFRFDWDLTKEPIVMTITCDGKVISTTQPLDRKGVNTAKPESLCPGDFKPYFGGLPDGSRKFDGAIGNIKY